MKQGASKRKLASPAAGEEVQDGLEVQQQPDEAYDAGDWPQDGTPWDKIGDEPRQGSPRENASMIHLPSMKTPLAGGPAEAKIVRYQPNDPRGRAAKWSGSHWRGGQRAELSLGLRKAREGSSSVHNVAKS